MSYKFNPFTNTMDRVVNTGLYFIDTIFSNNMTIPENKVPDEVKKLGYA